LESYSAHLHTQNPLVDLSADQGIEKSATGGIGELVFEMVEKCLLGAKPPFCEVPGRGNGGPGEFLFRFEAETVFLGLAQHASDRIVGCCGVALVVQGEIEMAGEGRIESSLLIYEGGEGSLVEQGAVKKGGVGAGLFDMEDPLTWGFLLGEGDLRGAPVGVGARKKCAGKAYL
jgi:hypothetical protein